MAMSTSATTRSATFPGYLPWNDQPTARRTEVENFEYASSTTHKGLWNFLSHHWTASISPLVGLACIFSVYGFTAWLSNQRFDCPTWALDCDVNGGVKNIEPHLGLVQGVVTTIFNIGMASMVYTACTLSEAAAWPILRQQPYALNEFENFLRASRGSLASLPGAYRSTRSFSAALIVLSLTTVLFTPLSGSTLVGYAYNRVNISTHYKYEYWAGGGVGFRFNQASPPRDRPYSIGIATSFYSSWTKRLTEEPLPELRGFVLDRNNLSRIGNFSVNTVGTSIDMNCSGHAVDVLDISDDGYFIQLWALGNGTTKQRAKIRVRVQPVLTTWVNDIQDIGEAGSVVTLVFAVINGTIEGGHYTNFTGAWRGGHAAKGISAVACRVEVNLIDAMASSGAGGANRTTISTLQSLHPPPLGNGTLHDIAAWIGIAPTVIGDSTFGAQPMFERTEITNLPTVETTWSDDKSPHWTIPELKYFVNVTAGAVLIGIANEFKTHTVEVLCKQFSARLDEKRTWVLLIPPAVVLTLTLLLAWWNSQAHRRLNLPTMRSGNIGELIRSSQTTHIRDAVALDLRDPSRPSGLGNTRVRYNIATPQGTYGFVNPSA